MNAEALGKKLVMSVYNNQSEELLHLIQANRLTCEQFIQNSVFSIPFPQMSVDEPSKKLPALIIPLDNLTLMHIAAFEDSLEVFITLYEIIKTTEVFSAESYLPIHYACAKGSLEVLAFIFSVAPEQVKKCYRCDYQCLHLATYSKCPRALEFLFHCGADITAPMYHKNDPIAWAIRYRSVECLKILLRYSPQSPRNSNDMTPIMLALVNLKPDAIPLLLEAGVDPKFINNDGNTALSFACFQSQKKIVKLLCDTMDNIDIPAERRGKTAVHWLCESKDPEIAKMMLAKNIDVNRFDRDGNLGPYYLLDVTDTKTFITIMKMLLDAGLDINRVANGNKNTFLGNYITGIKKQYEIIDWLLQHGANIDAPLKERGERISDFIINSCKKNDEVSGLHDFRRIAEKWLPDRYRREVLRLD